jgi:hypothetical protein
VALDGKLVTFHRNPVGAFFDSARVHDFPWFEDKSYRDWGIVNVNPAGTEGFWVNPDAGSWGTWSKAATGIEVSSSTGTVMGQGSVLHESPVLIKAEALGLTIYIVRRYADPEFLGNYNLAQTRRGLENSRLAHPSYFGHRKYWFFLDAVQGRDDIDSAKLFDLYQQAWQNDGWDGDEAALASWSSKHREGHVAFGTDALKATNPKRRPIHYNAKDLFGW